MTSSNYCFTVKLQQYSKQKCLQLTRAKKKMIKFFTISVVVAIDLMNEATSTWLIGSLSAEIFLSEYNCPSNSIVQIYTIATTVIVSIFRAIDIDIMKLLIDGVNS